MARIIILRSGYGRGSWRKLAQSERVMVSCPDCGLSCELDHDISTDGKITPSLDCPSPTCRFHEFVQLDGWISGSGAEVKRS